MGSLDLNSYEKIIVAFSTGKDSIACFLWLKENKVPIHKIELWHHEVDGEGPLFMDWECTSDYARKFAAAFGVPIYFSGKKGGFLTEMLRENSLTAPTYFETPDCKFEVGGTRGKPSTRRKFPQISPDLSVRWCSAYLKIDPCATSIRHQERFNNSRTLVLSGERGEESAARAKYEIFEPDRSDKRDGSKKRHVDRLRPLRDWTEQQVWNLIAKYKIRVHPAYYMGWGRVSCKWCIFGNPNQFASAFKLSPMEGLWMANLEKEFGYTMKRKLNLMEFIQKGLPYETITEELSNLAKSYNYYAPIFMENWILPAGAFGESCGPT